MITIEHRLTCVEDRSNSNTHRLNDLEKRQDNLEELVASVKLLAFREEKVERTVEEIKIDVEAIKNKPSKRWEKVVETAITVIVSALIGFVIAKFGL